MAATLKRLNQPALSPDLDWQRASLLCRVELAAGDADAALAARQQSGAGRAPAKRPARAADSVALRAARCWKQMQLCRKPSPRGRNNLTNAAPVEKQREAILKIAGVATGAGPIDQRRWRRWTNFSRAVSAIRRRRNSRC